MSRRRRYPTADSEVDANHNLIPISEEERIALFLSHKNLYESLWRTKKEAINEFNRSTKLMAGQGTDLKDLKIAVLLESPDGLAGAKADIDRVLRVARMIGHPLGDQLDLFRTEGEVDTSEEILPPRHEPEVDQSKRRDPEDDVDF